MHPTLKAVLEVRGWDGVYVFQHHPDLFSEFVLRAIEECPDWSWLRIPTKDIDLWNKMWENVNHVVDQEMRVTLT